MFKFSKLLSLLSAAIFTLIAGHAQAVPFVFTAYGTISSGYDSDGIFGIANTPLDAQSYRQTISFDPAQNTDNFATQYFESSQSPGAVVFTTTEVNGRIFSSEVASDATGSYATIHNFLTQLGSVFPGVFSWSDNVYVSACHSPIDTQFVCLRQSVTSTTNPFVPAATLNHTFSYTTQAGDTSEVSFFTNGIQGFAHFDGTVSAITWSTVPEPATLSLIGVGVFGISRLRRRKQA